MINLLIMPSAKDRGYPNAARTILKCDCIYVSLETIQNNMIGQLFIFCCTNTPRYYILALYWHIN
jgi:hypothetical protein